MIAPHRRNFLQTTGGALALTAASASRVLGANERIPMAVIGCGGMGTGHLGSLVKRSEADNIKVRAVSDVYQRRLTRAKGICQGEGYMDYRKLLERKDVDAVLIATPAEFEDDPSLANDDILYAIYQDWFEENIYGQ